jgi:hypothetical protein
VIIEGLQGDEWVVVAGLMRAIPGRTVTPEKSAAAPGAAAAPAPGPSPESK